MLLISEDYPVLAGGMLDLQLFISYAFTFV